MIGHTALAVTQGLAPLSPAVALRTWTVDPFALVIVLLFGGAYVVGMRACRRRGTPWPRGRAAAFLVGGLGSAVLATMSFVGAYDTTLFWLRAVQNMVLLMVTPLFLAMGGPISLAVAALPKRHGERVLAAVRSRAATVLAFPAVASALLIATPFVLYFTSWYALTLANGAVAGLLRLQLVATGFLFFWTLLRVDPVPREYPYLLALWVTFAEVVFDAALGVGVMAKRGLIAGEHYLSLARTWGPSPHLDQVFGGAALWAIGDVVGLPFLMAVMVQMLREDTRKAEEEDRLLDEAEKAEDGAEHTDDPPLTRRPWWESDPQLSERFRRP
jgi:cytochrome c oxidase assembly factor CtaG